jgi:hypothetical protein
MEILDLLPTNTLSNVRVGVSASPSPDLERLGLLEGHFRLTLGELARTVLVLGGSLQYCGHLDPNEITMFLIGELKRYGRLDEPLSVILAWSVHRQLALHEIERVRDDLGLFGSIMCLDPTGAPIDCATGRADAPPGVPDEQIAPSLSAMRQAAIRQSQGRLLVGGRRSGYQGTMPGVLEEALLAIEASQPVFLAGGFGGVTHDIVGRVEPLAAAWLPLNGELGDDAGWRTGLENLGAVIGARGWEALANGLNPAENARLAATHRPSEIAALVSLGLGRLAQAGDNTDGTTSLAL